MSRWRPAAILLAFLAAAALPAGAQTCAPHELPKDVLNCGTCGRNCNDADPNSVWTCETGTCTRHGCRAGFWDPDGDEVCNYACTFTSEAELCNGLDDDCDGQTDEGVVAPLPRDVCGVSPQAGRPECTIGVTVSCVGGNWQCTFPLGVCGSGSCATTPEVCDALDNNCNGLMNENVPLWNKACASDDGVAGGHGLCRTTGAYACSGPNAVACSAVKADCSAHEGGCTEECDGKDNDCDGLVDEVYTAKGANASHFVRPVVTKIGSGPNLWITSYEASRPGADPTLPGFGNGYVTSGPGEPLDRTRACFVANRQPWRGITPLEVEQTCTAQGGFVCSTTQAITACRPGFPGISCRWGYNPRIPGGCNAGSTPGVKFCNLGESYDSGGALGDQDAVLATGSGALANCWADWSGLQSNTAATDKVFDLTGNLREITKTAATTYTVVGGSYLTDDEDGGQCLQGFLIGQDDRFAEAGFRCCFNADPTL
jgi:hypothetical protein